MGTRPTEGLAFPQQRGRMGDWGQCSQCRRCWDVGDIPEFWEVLPQHLPPVTEEMAADGDDATSYSHPSWTWHTSPLPAQVRQPSLEPHQAWLPCLAPACIFTFLTATGGAFQNFKKSQGGLQSAYGTQPSPEEPRCTHVCACSSCILHTLPISHSPVLTLVTVVPPLAVSHQPGHSMSARAGEGRGIPLEQLLTDQYLLS